MINLVKIESDLSAAMKLKDSLTVGALRALKTRIQNEQIAKMRDLEEPEILLLIQSEIKRRKEAAAGFKNGDRVDAAKQEEDEAVVLAKYLPEQISVEKIAELATEIIAKESWTQKDFGKAMAALKSELGASASSSDIAEVLKEKLKS